MKRTAERGIRCFVAVELPLEMQEGIEKIQQELDLPGVKLVRPEQVHVTLKFLGETPRPRVEKVSEALRSVRVDPFSARIGGLGAFPDRSIRVIWLGARGNFADLHQEVERALHPFGFKRERNFTPHATLGRVRQPSREMSALLAARIEAIGDVEIGEFQVDRFFLKKSTLTPGGPIYEDMAVFPLR